MKFFVTDLSNCSWSAKAQLSLKRRETSELEILRARTESVKCVTVRDTEISRTVEIFPRNELERSRAHLELVSESA